MVKSAQYGVRHNSTRSVETMPLALELHGEIEGRFGRPSPKEDSIPRSIYRATCRRVSWLPKERPYRMSAQRSTQSVLE